MSIVRNIRSALVAASALYAVASTAATSPVAQNMRLLSHADMQGRAAFHAVIERHDGRTFAYVGHMGGESRNELTGRMEPNGTSILDVTDPRRPRYLAHIPGEPGQDESGGARTVRVCSGSALKGSRRGAMYLLRSNGSSSFEVWDVSIPAAPKMVSTVARGLRAAWRTWWECDTGIAYVIAGDPTWRSPRMLRVYDLSDPANPVFIRNFGLPGQEPGSQAAVPYPILTVRSSGVRGNRVYLGYGQRRGGVLQILDREKLLLGPREETSESLRYPEIARRELPENATANMLVPLLGMELAEFEKQLEGHRRDFIAVSGRSVFKECREARQMMWFVDTTIERRPYGVSSWTVAEKSGNYCSVGGRFGAQSLNENQVPVFAKRLLFVAHMNAGIRVLDVRNPFRPEQVAFYVPPVNRNTRVLETPPQLGRPVYTEAARRKAVQTTHVEVDDRGFIYAVDRASSGMEILELTGPARALADWQAAAR